MKNLFLILILTGICLGGDIMTNDNFSCVIPAGWSDNDGGKLYVKNINKEKSPIITLVMKKDEDMKQFIDYTIAKGEEYIPDIYYKKLPDLSLRIFVDENGNENEEQTLAQIYEYKSEAELIYGAFAGIQTPKGVFSISYRVPKGKTNAKDVYDRYKKDFIDIVKSYKYLKNKS
jgi:hypothetical protein